MKDYNIFAYRFINSVTNQIAQIWSIGWEKQTSSIYNWKGKNRKEEKKYIFQYTVSGFGMMELNGREYKLNAGKAFLVNITDDYRYYLPNNSDHWEFIFITLYGDAVGKCWDHIQKEYHPILHLQPDSSPIQFLIQIYQSASEKKIKNPFQASSLAYRFVMELYQYVKNMDTNENWPDSIMSSILFARNHFQEPIGPEEMAEAANLSRYHFTRLFKEITGETPIHFLTKIRIMKSAELLYETKYSIEDIAVNVGFTNANYLTKVFRKMTGMTPGEFRKSNRAPTEDLFL